MPAKKKINRTDKYVGVRFQRDAYETLEQVRGTVPRGKYLRTCFFIVTSRMVSPEAVAAQEIKAAIGRIFALLGKSNISQLGTLAEQLSKAQAVATPEVERQVHKGTEDLHELLITLRYIVQLCERQ